MYVPAGVLEVSAEISDSVKTKLITQLHITNVLDGYVYDSYLEADPEFANNFRRNNLRLMVLRTFDEFWDRGTNANWPSVDVALFIKKNGLASVEKNLYGPPAQTYKISELTWGKLCVFDRTYK